MLTIELLHTGLPHTFSTGLTQVVQKRLDYIRYSTRVPHTGVGVEFLGWPVVNALDVLNITDLSASIPENASLVFDDGITVEAGSILNVTTLNVLITDQASTDNAGLKIPLFYRHSLSTVAAADSVSIQAARWDGVLSTVDPLHYILSDGGRELYTDLKNGFDEDTGRYTVYYVQWLDSDGTSHEEILNSNDAYREVTIDDIDPDTGLIYSDAPAYWVTGTEPNLVLSMSHFATYYVKEKRESQIALLPPTLTTISDPWYISITDGFFEATIEGVPHVYSVSEFDNLDFTPVKPYLKAIAETAKKMSPALIKLQRENLYVDAVSYTHLDIILAEKTTGDVKFAFTTDPARIGTKYSTTDIDFTDKILDYDEPGGIVRLKENLIADKFKILAYYNYKATAYEFKSLNLNPFLNPAVLGRQIVFYLQPDQPDGDHSIWYLLVEDNVIVFASQPEFAEIDDDGNYNPGNIIGSLYINDGTSGSVSLPPEYLVLAEIFVTCSIGAADLELDVRVPGGGINIAWEDNAILAQPRVAYIPGVAPAGGYPWPRFGSLVVKVPYTLHLDYGGELTTQQIRDLVQKHMSAGEYAIIRFDGVIPEWGCGGADYHPLSKEYRGLYNDNPAEARLTWYREDPAYQFKIYRSNSINGVYTSIATVAGISSGLCNEYLDSGLTVGAVYYYYITALSPTNVEGPRSGIQGIRIY